MKLRIPNLLSLTPGAIRLSGDPRSNQDLSDLSPTTAGILDAYKPDPLNGSVRVPAVDTENVNQVIVTEAISDDSKVVAQISRAFGLLLLGANRLLVRARRKDTGDLPLPYDLSATQGCWSIVDRREDGTLIAGDKRHPLSRLARETIFEDGRSVRPTSPYIDFRRRDGRNLVLGISPYDFSASIVTGWSNETGQVISTLWPEMGAHEVRTGAYAFHWEGHRFFSGVKSLLGLPASDPDEAIVRGLAALIWDHPPYPQGSLGKMRTRRGRRGTQEPTLEIFSEGKQGRAPLVSVSTHLRPGESPSLSATLWNRKDLLPRMPLSPVLYKKLWRPIENWAQREC